ncbi:MAG TPA: nuclear transport factor 2 family protein [Candidatus Aminicenantes bacterium]|nr:nuclear transport factor 2 family protein [Candidatus Aminicenantes bacterium]
MTFFVPFPLLFSASALMLAAVPLSAQEFVTPDLNGPDTPANTVFRLENEAMEQWRQGNPLRWAEISTDDIVYVDPGLAAPVVGIEAYREYLTPLKGKVHYDASEFVEPRVALAGDLAVLTYNYHSLRRDADEKMQRTSFWNTTQVYVRHAGSWKIIHSHWSFIGHRQPAAVQVPLPITTGPARLAPVAAEILALEKAALKRWRQGDPDGFLALSVPQVTYFDPLLPGRLTGIAQLTEFYNGMRGKGGGPAAIDIIEPRVAIVGDAALLTYRFLWAGLDADGTVIARSPWHCSEVYHRQAGQWRIIHTHWSLIGGERAGGGV